MPLNYDVFSVEDLQAMKSGNLDGMSVDGLQELKRQTQTNYLPKDQRPTSQSQDEQVEPQFGAARSARNMLGGMYDVIGLPVDAVTGAMNFLGDSFENKTGVGVPDIENAVGGSQWLKGATDAVTTRGAQGFANLMGADTSLEDAQAAMAPVQAPAEGMGGNIRDRIDTELGSYATLIGPILKYAQTMKPAAQGSGGVVQQMLEGARTKPSQFAAKEGAATVGAATGAEVLPALTPDSLDPYAEMVGAVLGGEAALQPGNVAKAGGNIIKMSPTYQLTKVATNAVANQGARMASDAGIESQTLQRMAEKSREADQRRAMETLSKNFQGLNTPRSQVNIEEAERLREEIPGFNPTVAESSGLPSLLDEQREIEKSASGAKRDEYAFRRGDSRQAISDYAEGQAPKFQGNPRDQVLQAGERGLDRVTGRLDELQARSDMKAEDVASELPEVDRFQQGEAIRGRQAELRSQSSMEMDKLAREMGIRSEQPVPIDLLQQRLKGLKPSKLADADTMGVTYNKLMGYGKNQDQKLLTGGDQPDLIEGAAPDVSAEESLTFQDIKYAREQVGDEIRQALSQGQRSKARVLQQVQEQIDEFLDADAFAGDPTMQENYSKFREIYKSNFIDRFETDAARDVGAKGRGGDLRINNEDVARQYFKAGDVTSARQFKRTFGDDAQAKESLKAVALDDLRQVAVKDGKLDQAAFTRWKNKHASVLDEYPEIKAAVGNVGKANEQVMARNKQLDERRRGIAKTELNQKLNRYPDKIIPRAMEDPDFMKRLARDFTDEDKTAFAQIYWQEAMESARLFDPQKPANPSALKKFLKDNDAQMREFLGEQHVDALYNVQSSLETLQRSQNIAAGRSAEFSPLAGVEKNIGTSIPSIVSQQRSVAEGRFSLQNMMVNVMTKAGIATSRNAAKSMMERALYDEDFAKTLANFIKESGKPDSTKGKQSLRQMRTYLFTIGLDPAKEN